MPFRERVVDAKRSLPAKGGKPSLSDNLIIHGDNLEALKALLTTHAGKMDCIFIDPPYNTGNEGWCYNDNVRSPLMKEWLKKSANPVDKEDLERHDKWLCMMWPRTRKMAATGGLFWWSVRITKEIKEGVLKVIGERTVEETAPGLGGSFTFCELGAPMRIESLLSGKDMPGYEALARYVFYTATGHSLDKNTAWYLDGRSTVHWWHRIAVHQQSYGLQGWQRNRKQPLRPQ